MKCFNSQSYSYFDVNSTFGFPEILYSKLNSVIEGGGDIYFKGRPEITNSDNGGGSLINAN